MVDRQLTLRAGKATGVVPATSANSGQGKHRAGRDSMGYLRSTGAGQDFYNPGPANHHLRPERGIKYYRGEYVPRGSSGETDCMG